MQLKLAIFGFLASTSFTAAFPKEFHNSTLAERQDDPKFWKLLGFVSGCDDEETTVYAGQDDQMSPCTNAGLGDLHSFKMIGMAATAHKVLLYSDLGCLEQIGELNKDNACYSAPSDKPVTAVAIVPQ